jgi:hypothetical protein
MFRQHYWDDNRFVKTQAYLSHVKEMRNQEILTAHVGHPDYPAILNFLMQASSLQLEQTRLLSQVIELLPMKGTWFFDGGNITKVQQLPYHSFNVANYFDLGWIAPELQPFKLYYKNTDEKVLYKTLGFAYVTSGYGITKGSSKQDMLTSFGYASDVFREYYTNDRYNSIRGGSGLTGYTDPASNAIREHYRLKEQAYNAAVESAEHYVEGARIYKGLLFDGQNIYIAKHPGATCANYFDLSRVDPDARKREIRFFPGHEKLLYETLGFAFLVSTSVKTPGARREDIIAKHGKAPFKHHYSQQVWRSYEVSYPTQREIEYQKYSEALAIADMQRHMKHVKKRKQIKSIVTLAPAALVGSLIPGVGGVFVSGVIKGAAFSATHAALNGGNIEKAAFQGAVFAGVGGFAGKGPIGIVATSLVDSGLNGGNPLKKIGTTLAVNHIVDLAGLPEGLTKEFVKAGASSLISGSDIGTALMAGSIGAAGSLSQQIGDRIGSSIKDVAKNIFSKKEISEEETLLIIQYGQELEGTKSAHRWGKAEFERQSPEMRTKAYNTNKKIIKAYEKIEADIEKLIVEEAKLQLPNANEEKLRQIVSNQLHKYQSPRDRMKFIESLPKEFKLKANQYLSSQESNGYQKTALPLVIGAYEAALFITGLAYIGANCYQDWRRNNTGFPIENDFDEDAYKKPDLSLEEKLTRSTNGYQVEDPYGGRLRNPTPGFMPMFNGKKDLIMEKNKHKDLPGKDEDWVKLKGDQGWKNTQDGTRWKKDMLHKDHWDVMDTKGNKIKEIDFQGNQIWPGGPKNKNKKLHN